MFYYQLLMTFSLTSCRQICGERRHLTSGECVLISGGSHFQERWVHRWFTKGGFTGRFTKRGVSREPYEPPGYGPAETVRIAMLSCVSMCWT